MRQEHLNKRRLNSANIPTDEFGNLIQDKKYFVTSEQRAKCRVGAFHKKPHPDGTPVTGTYVQHCFGDVPENKDAVVE
ncbi:MAG: hypothetical protein LBN95_13720 [Prevotellaceae bacterium]|jgi:hypothetical protein|nr:hypothetical protein [Prevotellaceae bacterium]